MLKKLVPLVVVFFIGCATQPAPMPPPEPSGGSKIICDGVYIPGKGCTTLGAGSYGGAIRGHHEQDD